MIYSIKEIYVTLQGEGFHAGRRAIFCRFSGCNLWDGREGTRSSAACNFCDTDFVGIDGHHGGRYNSTTLVAECLELWRNIPHRPFIVLTGGEPLLQADEVLIDAFRIANFEIAIETNGTILRRISPDWTTVSPKSGQHLALSVGDEIKLIYPQNGIDPYDFVGMGFTHFYLQPMDGPRREENTLIAAEYCLANPPWKLSLQIHKIIGMP